MEDFMKIKNIQKKIVLDDEVEWNIIIPFHIQLNSRIYAKGDAWVSKRDQSIIAVTLEPQYSNNIYENYGITIEELKEAISAIMSEP
jgi:hypothetical protein